MAGGWSARARMSGSLTEYADGFEARLLELGYRRGSVDAQMLMVARLDGWLAERGLDASDLTAEVVAEWVALRAAGRMHFRSQRGVQPLLDYLRELGAAPAATAPAVVTPLEVLLERFGSYLIAERGLTAGTARSRVRIVEPFVATAVSKDGVLELDRLTASDAGAFVVAASRRHGPRWAREAGCALRSLLGFLHLEGLVNAELAASVPSVATWRLSGLPPRLAPGGVRRLLDSCDPVTVVGRRDLAILTLLARLGLRAGEVAALSLDDVDWRAGELRIRTARATGWSALPLPADVGEALADYLQRGGRPRRVPRSVFVRGDRAARAMTGSGGVEVVVRAAVARAWARSARTGCVTRAATDMLRAGRRWPRSARSCATGCRARPRSTPRSTATRCPTLARPWPRGGAVMSRLRR